MSIEAWWQHNQSEQQKLKLERERIGDAFRKAGSESVKIQQAQKQKTASSEDDTIAPHELSDEGELAQAKLWQSLPKEKRSILQIETIKAGLTAKSVNN